MGVHCSLEKITAFSIHSVSILCSFNIGCAFIHRGFAFIHRQFCMHLPSILHVFTICFGYIHNLFCCIHHPFRVHSLSVSYVFTLLSTVFTVRSAVVNCLLCSYLLSVLRSFTIRSAFVYHPFCVNLPSVLHASTVCLPFNRKSNGNFPWLLLYMYNANRITTCCAFSF